MSNLTNISTKQLFELPNERSNEYFEKLQYVQGLKDYQGNPAKEASDLPYGKIILWRKGFDSKMEIAEAFKAFFNIDIEAFDQLKTVEFFGYYNYIRKELRQTVTNEANVLSTPADAKWKEAGIDELNQFGELNSIIAVAEKYGKSPEEIEAWSYGLVFALMWQASVYSQVQKRYMKLIQPKQ